MIRDLAEKILVRAGFEVELADSGAEARVRLRGSATSVDLILLDLTLGDCSGLDILAEIRASVPSLPVIISSGDSLNRFRLPDHLADHTRLLEKPYRSSALADLVREMLAL